MSIQIKNYLNATADLLQEALTEARTVDPAGAAGLAGVLRAGGLLCLRSTLAPSTGLAQILVEVTEPSGASHVLMSMEITKKPH